MKCYQRLWDCLCRSSVCKTFSPFFYLFRDYCYSCSAFSYQMNVCIFLLFAGTTTLKTAEYPEETTERLFQCRTSGALKKQHKESLKHLYSLCLSAQFPVKHRADNYLNDFWVNFGSGGDSAIRFGIDVSWRLQSRAQVANTRTWICSPRFLTNTLTRKLNYKREELWCPDHLKLTHYASLNRL